MFETSYATRHMVVATKQNGAKKGRGKMTKKLKKVPRVAALDFPFSSC